MTGVSSHTASGTPSIAPNARYDREPASNTAMPWPSRTADAKISRASVGWKWWNAVKTVRNPVNRSGTSRALTDSASKRTPGIFSATFASASVLGYLSVRHSDTVAFLARNAGRRSSQGPPPPEQRSTICLALDRSRAAARRGTMTEYVLATRRAVAR